MPNSVKALYLLGLGEAYAQVADLSPMDDVWFRLRTWDTAEVVSVVSDPSTHVPTTLRAIQVHMIGRRGNVHRYIGLPRLMADHNLS